MPINSEGLASSLETGDLEIAQRERRTRLGGGWCRFVDRLVDPKGKLREVSASFRAFFRERERRRKPSSEARQPAGAHERSGDLHARAHGGDDTSWLVRFFFFFLPRIRDLPKWGGGLFGGSGVPFAPVKWGVPKKGTPLVFCHMFGILHNEKSRPTREAAQRANGLSPIAWPQGWTLAIPGGISAAALLHWELK